MTTLQEAAQYRSLYELTGDIKDFNTMLVPRTALAQQGEPIYQYKRADGAWIDQTKASYDYNQKYCPDATVSGDMCT